MSSPPSDERPALARLHEAMYKFSSEERLLKTRYSRTKGSLSPSRVQALNVLLYEREMTAGALARASGLRPNSITGILEQLEQIGLVTRRQDDTDRRVWWISLTDEGRALLATLKEDWDHHFAEAFADVSDRDLAIGAATVERLAEVFGTFNVGSD